MTSTTRYILKRVVLFVPVIIAATMLVFTLIRLTPSDPISIMFGEYPGELSEEAYERLKAKLGLDKPFHIQYLRFLENLFHGNLGYSYRWQHPVSELLKRNFMATFELTLVGLLLSIIIGLPLGIISALKRNKIIDHFIRIFTLGGIAAPVFWFAIILQLVFYVSLGILPGESRIGIEIELLYPLKRITGLLLLDSLLTRNWPAFISASRHIILPSVALSYRAMALITRMSRSAMLEVLEQNYILTGKAYGLKRNILIFKYAFKNTLIPVLTTLGLAYGSLLQGTWLIESVFNWPGMGLWASQAIILSDYASIMAVSLVAIVTYLVVNLIVDISYTFVDPRIKY